MKKFIFIKKLILILLIGVILFTAIILLLNIKVTTLQGISYEVHTIKIPLYLKMLDFMDRHYNYKQLVKRIIKNEDEEKNRVMNIFSWTYHNIKKQPDNLPVIDDHAWHIIVRGYGVHDQSCDVFATLCNYAGVDAFFNTFYTKEKDKKISLSFATIHNHLYVFDPYNGVYFVKTTGDLADFTEIKRGNFRLEHLGDLKKTVLDYKSYFNNMPDIKEVGLRRETVQSPFNRLLYELKK